MSFFANRFPSLARHMSIFRESWRAQNEFDRAARPKDEHQFLPAALEIMEKPPSPGMRWLLILTCGLFVLALIWAVIGKVDVVAVASGKTVPGNSVKVVQPLEIGSVRAIHVRNGQFVRAGDLLIELDPTLANADEAQSEQSLLSARVLQARNDALLAHLQGKRARFEAPEGTPEDIVSTEAAYVRSAIAQYEAQRAGFVQQQAARTAELEAAESETAKLREALPYLERQLAARAELAGKGYFSQLKLLEYEQLLAEHRRNIEIQEANARRARASIGSLAAELRTLRETFGKTAVTDLAEANDRAGLAGEELRKAARRREMQQLRAPVDGVVQQLTVTTIGGVVQPAQPLMVIVPCEVETTDTSASCNGDITVEALVQNKDIGFVKTGQRVAVKLETFNFTDYGLIEGTVTNISRDAIEQGAPAASNSPGNSQAGRENLAYAARIELNCDLTGVASQPLCLQVQPGMAVQAEIKTGKRRIIQYLLSPISQALGEAGRER